MIPDAQNQYSAAQALTVTAVSTNYVDHQAVRQLGKGEPMVVMVVLTVASDFTTGNETYTFQLGTDDNTSFSSETLLGSAIAIVGAQAAGTLFFQSVPLSGVERYTRLTYTLAGTSPTVTLDAWLHPFRQMPQLQDYADSLTPL